MNEEDLREKVLDILFGGLWHTTKEDRYKSIVEIGAIIPNPSIPDSERWGNEENPHFVRKLGGVSLFDFKNFDRNKVCSCWGEFVPYLRHWGASVWIEINRDEVQDKIISPKTLVDKWDQRESRNHNVMPHLEAAYIGKIPTCFFQQVLLVNESGVKDFYNSDVNF